MQIHITQVYVEQGAECPFNCVFQNYISEQLTSLVVPSSWFSAKYGEDWNLIFRISARWSLEENEIRGPTVFRKDKDVEFSIFLPFRRVIESETPPVTALNHIFVGMYSVLEKMQIDTTELRTQQDRIVKHICSEPKMFAVNPTPESGIGPPVWPVVPKA